MTLKQKITAKIKGKELGARFARASFGPTSAKGWGTPSHICQRKADMGHLLPHLPKEGRYGAPPPTSAKEGQIWGTELGMTLKVKGKGKSNVNCPTLSATAADKGGAVAPSLVVE
jgi:hypothetical protein